MKKLIKLFLILVLMLGTWSCASFWPALDQTVNYSYPQYYAPYYYNGHNGYNGAYYYRQNHYVQKPRHFNRVQSNVYQKHNSTSGTTHSRTNKNNRRR